MAISKVWNIGESGGKNPSAALYRSLVYITNPDKTDGGRLVGSNLCMPTALETNKAIERFFVYETRANSFCFIWKTEKT